MKPNHVQYNIILYWSAIVFYSLVEQQCEVSGFIAINHF